MLSAKKALGAFNRHVQVKTYNERFMKHNAMRILTDQNWDVVMDGSDNAATRYLISDACV